MPQRSNEFQELITIIEALLAPEGAHVTESRMLRDLATGELREVDVAIETRVGEHPVIIGIECQDHRRKAEVRWIDSMIGKY